MKARARELFAQLLLPHRGDVPAINGLRALSVLWVMLQHVQIGLKPWGVFPEGAAFLASPLLRVGWAGNLGVDVFFVISGYLIGGMLLREREETGALSFGRFYLRRAMRILPAYVAVIALNVALAEPNGERAWTNLLFVNDFVPFQQQFMAHTWSLAIEEQFYALFPLFVVLLYLVRPSFRTALVACAVPAFAAISMAVVLRQHIELSLVHPDATQFWRYMDLFYVRPYARFGALFVGVLVARLERSTNAVALLGRRPVVAGLLFALALAALAFVVLVFPECRAPDGTRLLSGSLLLALESTLFASGIGAIVLLSRASSVLGRAIARVLGVRVLQPFAQLSYAAYLIHPNCIPLLLRHPGFDIGHAVPSYLVLVALSFGVSFLAAFVVFALIEHPIMKLRPPRRGVAW